MNLPYQQSNPTPGSKKARNRLTPILLALLGLCLALILLHGPILTGVADFLIQTNDPLHKADVIFILNGDYDTRPFYAVKLYQQGLAPKVLIAQSENSPAVDLGVVENSTAISVQVMLHKGLPPEALTVLNKDTPVTSTFDEARSLRAYVEANQVKKVILVTSSFHTRRARWILEKELKGSGVELQVAGAPHSGFNDKNWWKTEDGLVFVNNEYIKLLFYWLNY